MRKASRGLRDRSGFCARLFHPISEVRIDGHTALGRQIEKALREIEVASGERSVNLTLGDALREDAVERPIADLDRVVGGGKKPGLVDGDGTDCCGRASENNRAEKRDQRMADLPDE